MYVQYIDITKFWTNLLLVNFVLIILLSNIYIINRKRKSRIKVDKEKQQLMSIIVICL